MDVEIIESLKHFIPKQNSEIGTETLKTLLCYNKSTEKYFVVYGIGEDSWVIMYGRKLRPAESVKVFAEIDEKDYEDDEGSE